MNAERQTAFLMEMDEVSEEIHKMRIARAERRLIARLEKIRA